MLETIYDKVSVASRSVPESAIVVKPPGVVQLPYGRGDVVGFRRESLDLVLQLRTGKSIRIVNFYEKANGCTPNELVLEDADGTLWWARPSDGMADFQFRQIQSVDQLLGTSDCN